MDAEKRQRLEMTGWKAGTVEEFLGLSPQEIASIETRLKKSKGDHAKSNYDIPRT
ncbi:hypothetical protein [Pseudanabaena sp. SR411]|jgi:hypothetical protein|uniref:hypothetical protein n=1 Tax=Pseudanabaena sp. SR411 TaxID=1980935 RepID=UPI00159615AE|nr:hypothetical protein [Pseudanabaena sp. SR411]